MTAMQTCHSLALHVEDSLRQHADAIDQVASGEWRVFLHGSTDLTITAHTIGEAWLVLTALLPSLHVASLSRAELWTLLEWNGTLPGGVRFAVPPGAPCLSLQAEIAIDHETNLTARVAEICAGFHGAWVKVHGNKEERAKALSTGSAPVTEKTCDLPSLCHEAEWPFTERPDGRVTVELDLPRDTVFAMLTRCPGEGVRMAVELMAAEVLAEPCQQALGLMLLTIGGVVRMTRAVAEHNADRSIVRYEVNFTSAPTASEVAHALSALSVAVRLCRREMEVLQHDEKIAKEYLALW